MLRLHWKLEKVDLELGLPSEKNKKLKKQSVKIEMEERTWFIWRIAYDWTLDLCIEKVKKKILNYRDHSKCNSGLGPDDEGLIC